MKRKAKDRGGQPVPGSTARRRAAELTADGSWAPPATSIAGKLGLVKFTPDETSHLAVIDDEVCRRQCPQKFCAHACPAQVYRWEMEEKRISIAFEGCLECGTCRSGGCPFRNIEMRYPRGGYGVQYRFG